MKLEQTCQAPPCTDNKFMKKINGRWYCNAPQDPKIKITCFYYGKSKDEMQRHRCEYLKYEEYL